MKFQLSEKQLLNLIDTEEDLEVCAGRPLPQEMLFEALDEKALDDACNNFPVLEMIKRGWIKALDDSRNLAELVREFLEPLVRRQSSRVLCRRTFHQRSADRMDKFALLAWTAKILIEAEKENLPAYTPGIIDSNFLAYLVKLSTDSEGPILARKFLADNGIHLVILPHLPKIKLDGASMLDENRQPVVGLTLRYDRIDYFWFTLMHELAHVALHLEGSNDPNEVFVDDLDGLIGNAGLNTKEVEADMFARNALIPISDWRPSRVKRQKTPEAIIDFAEKMKIHPAIVAGRIRYESGNYSILNDLVGIEEVRKLFQDIDWQTKESRDV